MEGIGPKKAVELLSKYQTLEGIYENIDEIKGAAQQKLIKDRDSAFHCKEMAIIIDEVPVEFDLEHCQTDDLDMDLVERYFQELEFSSLHRRVQKWHSHFINAKNHAASMENLMKQETLF
ncbi:MAG: 5'-3' exonuclease H3TH domain-containing protein [Patescibacteria group bacterium]|nr:5'-3' exonuclease H3TH domain-containing protein [Patescibacteria group bacterium]